VKPIIMNCQNKTCALIIILQVHVQLLVFSSYFAQQLPVCMNAMCKN